MHYLNCARENQIGLLNACFVQSYQMDSAQMYQVNIILIASGALVMIGAYTDSTLTNEDGYFYYFFGNGNPESEGQFSNGAKTGVWKRWDFIGASKADRLYPAAK
jgi:antitoxin component YwqK of YwqJK toxin-antitoxin module